MALLDDDQHDGFTFIWTIHNFSYCVQKTGERLQSPRFTVKSNLTEEYFLALLPRGTNSDDNVYIAVSNGYSPKMLRVNCVFSVRTIEGSYKKASNEPLSNGSVFWIFLSKQEIFKTGTGAYLDNDTLIIRCRIIKVDGTILKSEQCYARTVVSGEKAIYSWNLKALSDLEAKEHEIEKQINLPEISSFSMNVSVTKGISSEDKLEIIIKRTNANKLYFSTCAISLLDTGKVLQSMQDEHWFEISTGEQIWTITFAPKTNFLTNSKHYSTMYLRCEFVVSFGEEYSKIEKTACGSTAEDLVVFPKPKIDSDILGTWKDNLRCFYSEGKISDFTIRTPRKEFPVHKAMLCAQSPVFCAMFERDMKENRTGIVEIEDLEDDTVSLMLLFVYTCSVENLDWEKASNLYFAADKYEMTALKEKCSIFLKENLSVSNVCKCLVLADTHQDQELKLVVQEFIIGHSAHVIISDEWKELMKEKVHLAAEAMHIMFVRNLKV